MANLQRMSEEMESTIIHLKNDLNEEWEDQANNVVAVVLGGLGNLAAPPLFGGRGKLGAPLFGGQGNLAAPVFGSGGNMQPQKQAYAITRSAMRNNTGVGIVKFQEKKDWSGSKYAHYPSKISHNRTGKFLHRGVPPNDLNGSMGAMMYVGPNQQGGSDNCAWILAWSVPGNGFPNKVYVETGPSTKYPRGQVNWDVIKRRLENSTYDGDYYDDDTETAISASIDQYGNTPALAAVFDVGI